jgi:hypothetical protein
MAIQRKLFISLLAGTVITFGTPVHAGFLGNLLGGAADAFVPGTGRVVNELTNEIDGTNDRIRQEALNQQRLEAQRQAEEERANLRRQIEAEVRAEMEAQRVQTAQPSIHSSPNTNMEQYWRQADERVCSQTTASSAAFQSCVRNKRAQRESLNGTNVGRTINQTMDQMRQQLGPNGDALFDAMFGQGAR